MVPNGRLSWTLIRFLAQMHSLSHRTSIIITIVIIIIITNLTPLYR